MAKILNILFVLIGLSAFAQELKVNVSIDKILIGEPVTLTYTVDAPKNSTILFEAKQDNIEVREKNSGLLTDEDLTVEIIEAFTDTVKFNNGKKQWIGRYTVTAWDSGTFIIPGPKIKINDIDYRFKNASLYSNYSSKVKGVDIYDINEEFVTIPDEPFSVSKFIGTNWWWLLLILLAIPAYFIIKRGPIKKQKPRKLYQAMSLKERTLLAIDALDNEKLWEQDKLKEHFVELSYILRSYLTARYNLSLLEKTTYETSLLLTQKGLDEDTVANIARILSEADMVKFAKSVPDVISILRVSTLARQIVAETSPLEFNHVE